MSIRVELEDLSERLVEYGMACLLITVGDDLRPHPTNVTVELLDDGGLACSGGRRTAANATARPLVTMVWSAPEAGGHSLIVDGRASVDETNDERRLTVQPTSAILHRPSA